jgi:hypothetical protein
VYWATTRGSHEKKNERNGKERMENREGWEEY